MWFFFLTELDLDGFIVNAGGDKQFASTFYFLFSSRARLPFRH